MVLCSHCNCAIPDNALYCPNCGASRIDAVTVSDPPALNQAPKPAAEPVREEKPVPKRDSNGYAIAGVILAFIFPPVGFILSILGIVFARKGRYKDPLLWLAIVGLILNALILFSVILMVLCVLDIIRNFSDSLSPMAPIAEWLKRLLGIA